MRQVLSITRKELSGYFGSAMALIFVGVFLAAALFTFFWVETFFARGIADVRPLFSWMPVLMIFLVAALTMRQWSEEQRAGTLEMLLTLPVSNLQLVLGKFLAVMALVALSLALTIFVPITVSLIGPLDWGPVVGGYLAALLMAAAYTAIGLFISSRTDNQIVALILTSLVCGVFYLLGSRGLTDLVGGTPAEVLRLFGAGSRFESIERGVIDLRDLAVTFTLAGIFLTLNIVSLDRKRWSTGPRTTLYRRAVNVTSALVVVNLLLVNVWLYPLNTLRLDLTAQREYSLSQTTRDLLGNLQEPLLLRGYFSQKTHPLLSPLIPQVEDLLREYQIAGRGKVEVDTVDPITDPDKEAEAADTYGIRPTALQVAGRYEASVINSYFDILVRYGDQNVVLNFRDLIESEPKPDGTVNVHLRNLEYDVTAAIKKVVYGFQSVDAVLAAMESPVKLTLFATTNALPAELKTAPDTIAKVARELQDKSGGKFTFETVDPDAAGAKVNRQALYDTYKLQPIAASLFSNQTYYLDMVLQVGDTPQVLSVGGEVSEANVRTAIESALKRSSSGFLKVVGVWVPPETPTQDMFGQTQQPISTYRQVGQQLSQDYTVRPVDLSAGQVPADIDVLVLVAPQGFTDTERFAVDQYLMRGGSVVVASGSYLLDYDQYGTGWLSLKPVEGGVADLLEGYGIRIEKSLVLDQQNEPMPIQQDRQVGGQTVREYQAMNYPFFVDVRPDGMDKSSPIVSQLQAVTMNWASPLTVDAEKNKNRTVTTLLKSTPQSWLRTDTTIIPDLQKYPQTGFPVEGQQGPQTLAVSVQGVFESYFKGKPNPLSAAPTPAPNAGQQGQAPVPTPGPQTSSTIDSSPDTARLVVVGSSEFLTDVVFQISSGMSQNRYLNSLQFLQNSVDWSAEDLDLLTIRSRGTSSRVLNAMTTSQETTVEVVNYGLALLAVVGIGALWSIRRRNERPMDLDERARGGVGSVESHA